MRMLVLLVTSKIAQQQLGQQKMLMLAGIGATCILFIKKQLLTRESHSSVCLLPISSPWVIDEKRDPLWRS